MGMFGLINNSVAAAIVYRAVRKSTRKSHGYSTGRSPNKPRWEDTVEEWWPPQPPEDDD